MLRFYLGWSQIGLLESGTRHPVLGKPCTCIDVGYILAGINNVACYRPPNKSA